MAPLAHVRPSAVACAAVVAREHNLRMVMSLMSACMASAHCVSQRMLLVLPGGAGTGGLGVRREGGGRRHGGASFPSVGVVGWLVGGLEQRSSRVLAGMGGGQRSGRAGEDETLDGGVGGWVHGYSMDGMAGLVGQTTSFSTLQAE
ncbi:hypothetical protein KC365_g45 [Hortaea werneckii]|nr:hypothetical protein KC365_g45 [Hortaea werneckii]